MSSTLAPNCLTFRATAAIPRGSVVKPGATSDYVTKSTAATAKNMGVAQNAAEAADDLVEVALPGGGGFGLAGGTIAEGDLLTSDASGALIATTSANDRVVAVAMQDAVAGDIFSIQIQISNV